MDKCKPRYVELYAKELYYKDGLIRRFFRIKDQSRAQISRKNEILGNNKTTYFLNSFKEKCKRAGLFISFYQYS